MKHRFETVFEEQPSDASRWRGLKAIGTSISNTTRRSGDSIEIRYNILDKSVSGTRFASAVRSHWGIKNSIDWQLDVTFGEDQSRIRKVHANENFSMLRRTALSLLKQQKTGKCGVKNKRLKSGWDGDYLAKLVFAA
uniref:ISAs1 family transposase n=1 Tax=Rubripirellula reticaptiva TaxID=2528013 RepID=UPI0036F21920